MPKIISDLSNGALKPYLKESRLRTVEHIGRLMKELKIYQDKLAGEMNDLSEFWEQRAASLRALEPENDDSLSEYSIDQLINILKKNTADDFLPVIGTHVDLPGDVVVDLAKIPIRNTKRNVMSAIRTIEGVNALVLNMGQDSPQRQEVRRWTLSLAKRLTAAVLEVKVLPKKMSELTHIEMVMRLSVIAAAISTLSALSDKGGFPLELSDIRHLVIRVLATVHLQENGDSRLLDDVNTALSEAREKEIRSRKTFLIERTYRLTVLAVVALHRNILAQIAQSEASSNIPEEEIKEKLKVLAYLAKNTVNFYGGSPFEHTEHTDRWDTFLKSVIFHSFATGSGFISSVARSSLEVWYGHKVTSDEVTNFIDDFFHTAR